jgi:hypothetical protein
LPVNRLKKRLKSNKGLSKKSKKPRQRLRRPNKLRRKKRLKSVQGKLLRNRHAKRSKNV